MLKKSYLHLVVLTLIVSSSSAVAESYRKAGQWYFAWGWNNANYTNSDIHFKGPDHDFTLSDVEANDRQSEIKGGGWLNNFLDPSRISIPQTNQRLGYFITDNVSITFAIDHMKYVMDQDQVVAMDGYLQAGSADDKLTSDGTIQKTLTKDFLQYEHTDGLNYISIAGEYYHSFWQPIHGVDFSLVAGGGAGFLYPKTNVTFLNREKNDEFHNSGYGYDIKSGIEISFFEDFFFRYIIKVGHIDMQDITTSDNGDSAKQKFDFIEYYGVFGYRF